MDRIWVEVVLNAMAVVFTVLVITFASNSLQGVHNVAAQTDGLEKVKETTLIDSATTEGITVKGGDVIGAIRYYQGTPDVSLEVRGWGVDRSYGASAGNLNREWVITDFPVSSELEFYSALFKITRAGNTVVYTKI